MGDKKPILEVKHLKKYFPVDAKHTLKAVDDVSFTIYEGETLGIVGESGCGKTTCGRTRIGVYEATSGEVLYKGKDINKMTAAKRKEFTKKVQMIFQDPYSSLDPRMKVHDIIAEGMQIHKLVSSKAEEIKAVQSLLEQVGLNPEHASRYVHEFSGGQRQRIGIARALAVNPDVLLFDEPTSALDPELVGEVLNTIKQLAEEDTTMILVTHEIRFARNVATRIIFMDGGQIVVDGTPEEVIDHPENPRLRQFLNFVTK